MKKLFLLPASVMLLAFSVGCSHNYADDKEKQKAIEEAQQEEVEVDKDAIGDDEIELND